MNPLDSKYLAEVSAKIRKVCDTQRNDRLISEIVLDVIRQNTTRKQRITNQIDPPE